MPNALHRLLLGTLAWGCSLPARARGVFGPRLFLSPAIWLFLYAACVPPATADTTSTALTEAQLRARFVLNFLRFTDWPSPSSENSSSPDGNTVQVCVLGTYDPFEGALGELQGVVASGRHVLVRGTVALEQVAGCNALYVPDNNLRLLPAARLAAGADPLLIIGESELALDRGAHIGMRLVNRHLGFVVRMGAVRRMNLHFSPQMLNAAAEVLP